MAFHSLPELERVAAKHGLTVTQRGAAIEISGPGVHVVVAHPRDVTLLDLQPVRESYLGRHKR